MSETALLPGLALRAGTVDQLDTFGVFWLAMFEEIGILTERDLPPDWRERFHTYMERRMAVGEGAFFVAMDGARIVGTAGAIVSDGYPFAVNGIKRGYIFGVRVDPEYRKRGIAEVLTQQSIEFLRTAGCIKIRLHASPFGRAIYERMGFLPTNEMELRPPSSG